MVEITEITDKLIGKKISCFINNKKVKEGVIVKDKNKYYILQDIEYGASLSGNVREQYKYKGYWCVYRGNKEDIIQNAVKDIKLLNTSHIYEVW
jgi:hypothetical protein